MAGTFSSLNTALTALRYQQVRARHREHATSPTSATDGYVRRRVVGETVGAPRQPAMWARSERARQRRAGRPGRPARRRAARRTGPPRARHASPTSTCARPPWPAWRPGSPSRPGTGRARALADVPRRAGTTWPTHPAATPRAARCSPRRNALVDAIAAPAPQRRRPRMGDQRMAHLDGPSTPRPTPSPADLAATNETITAARPPATTPTTLMDARDQIALRLAELTGAHRRRARPTAVIDVTLDGVALVSGNRAGDPCGVERHRPPTARPTDSTPDAGRDPAGRRARPRGADCGGEIGGTAELLDHHAAGVLARRHPGRRPGPRRRRQRRPRCRLRRRRRTPDDLFFAVDPDGIPAARWCAHDRPGGARRVGVAGAAQPRRHQRDGRGRRRRPAEQVLPALRQRLRHQRRLGQAARRQPAGADDPGRRRPRAARRGQPRRGDREHGAARSAPTRPRPG